MIRIWKWIVEFNSQGDRFLERKKGYQSHRGLSWLHRRIEASFGTRTPQIADRWTWLFWIMELFELSRCNTAIAMELDEYPPTTVSHTILFDQTICIRQDVFAWSYRNNRVAVNIIHTLLLGFVCISCFGSDLVRLRWRRCWRDHWIKVETGRRQQH